MNCVSRAGYASKLPCSLPASLRLGLRHAKPGKGEGHPVTTSCFCLVIGDSLRETEEEVQSHLDNEDLVPGFPGPWLTLSLPIHPLSYISPFER